MRCHQALPATSDRRSSEYETIRSLHRSGSTTRQTDHCEDQRRTILRARVRLRVSFAFILDQVFSSSIAEELSRMRRPGLKMAIQSFCHAVVFGEGLASGWERPEAF